MHKSFKIVLLSALVGVSGIAAAAYDGSRDDRMQSALDNYRKNRAYHDARNPSPGRAARAEESVKRGASNTGHAIKRGASKVGHAVGTGLHKTGVAIDHAGQKLKGKSSDAQ